MDDRGRETSRVMVDAAQMKAFWQDPLILDEGDGVRVRDTDGKWYIDGVSGTFVTSLGHRNQRAIAAAEAQMQKLAFHAPLLSTNPPALQLAELLSEIAPAGFSTVKFFSGGSEATEAAMKMARQYHYQNGNGKKFKIFSHYRSYHGNTGHAIAASGSPGWRSVYEPYGPGFVHVHPPFTYRKRFGLEGEALAAAAASLLEETIVLEGPETIAAFITEPILMSAGVEVPPPGYLERVRALCDEYDVLLIFDEIITGFGRVGDLFAANLFGVTPDLLCVAKGISSGYFPLSATLVQDRIAKLFWGEADDNVHYRGGHTYAGNPVACAVGLTVIGELIERDLPGNARRMGARLKAGLARLMDKHPCLIEVRGEGLLVAVGLGRDRATGEPYLPEVKFGHKVIRRAREHGLLLRDAPDFVVFSPPLTIDEAQVDEMLAIFDRALAEVLAESGANMLTKTA